MKQMVKTAEYKIFIGLETHIQLKTKTKLFCNCEVTFQERPNSRTCPVCLGAPGSLPRVNMNAIELALRACLLLNMNINMTSRFDRKNYFYPDLPKNYQISQYDIPLGYEGYMILPGEGQERKIEIQRIHLEEDAGKLLHSEDNSKSFIDLNRAGAPLIEVVTHPYIHKVDDAIDYVKNLRLMTRQCGISDCNMEKGELRCDVNLSLGRDDTLPGYKSEIKNMNSFKFMKQALTFELSRQKEFLDRKESPGNKTYGFDVTTCKTFEMRSKEEAMDYRYFPEPDLPPLVITRGLLEKVRKELSETPQQKLKRLIKQYSITDYQATILVEYDALTEDFEYCAKKYDPVKICNWLINDVVKIINDRKLDTTIFTKIRDDFTRLVRIFSENKITNIIAKEFLEKMLVKGEKLDILLKTAEGSSVDLDKIISEVLTENPKAVEDYKGGKEASSKFLLGQVMKKSRGKIAANKALKALLTKLGTRT